MSPCCVEIATSTLQLSILDERSTIAALEARVRKLEARETFRYLGVWNANAEYVPGNFCTRSGAIWHCNRRNIGTPPGSNPQIWVMAVKRGTDAK